MIETKIVVVKDGQIINVGKMEFPVNENGAEIIPDGVTVEEREMEYTLEYGWREVGWERPLTDKERITQLEQENETLKDENEVLNERVTSTENTLLDLLLMGGDL